jgi:hypothetical protein
MSVPTAKKTLLKISPHRREKMSVSFPDNGWHAELAIKYPVASHESKESDSNSDEMGPDRVATTVVSSMVSSCYTSAEVKYEDLT